MEGHCFEVVFQTQTVRADPQRESSAFDLISCSHQNSVLWFKLKNFVPSHTKTQDESTAVKALKRTAHPERSALSSNVLKGNGATLLHLSDLWYRLNKYSRIFLFYKCIFYFFGFVNGIIINVLIFINWYTVQKYYCLYRWYLCIDYLYWFYSYL